ncbi:DUF2520 domain-containing protein [Vicingaceae bacterium]|jgi:predicted short-subunit dehydrogenase-like oxidoreductase (DUF2520 family)|nr:DUF2520 domain-containing protein [Vicingaceae bacterium]
MAVALKKKRITLIGAGNVATNLGAALKAKGHIIHQVFSRSHQNAMILGHTMNCDFTTRLADLNDKTDFIIVAVHDDSINDILGQLKIKDKLIVHTSGTTSLKVFEDNKYKQYGIFYPLQTFSKHDVESLLPIPISVEAPKKKVESDLIEIASSISKKVFLLDSEKRKALHVAAVFANNFSNYMFQISHQILEQENISFELIKPLIKRTVEKLEGNTPYESQTGPAVRNDQKIISNHIEFLKDNKEFQQVYALLSESLTKSRK